MAAIETLAEYRGTDGHLEILGAFAGSWWNLSEDRTDQDPPRTRYPATLPSDRRYSDDRWNTSAITNSLGTTFLVAANGVDQPVRFTGRAFEPASVSLHPDFADPALFDHVEDFDASRLAGVSAFKNRLWWWERSGLRIWYGDLFSPGGQLKPFYLGAVANEAGDVADIAKISRDGGAGPDDYLVILLKSGTAIVYQGTDPDFADSFGLVGRFFTGQPLGARPLVEYGGDLLVLTRTGLLQASLVLSGRPLGQSDPVSANIRNLWLELAEHRHHLPGWNALVHPNGSKLIVNVPHLAEDAADGLGTGRQLVLNLTTGAWCEWRGLDAGAWSRYGDGVFFAHRERADVIEADVPDLLTDEGEPIRFLYQGAYSYMPNPGRFGVQEGGETVQKRLTYMIPGVRADGAIQGLEAAVQADFEEAPEDQLRWRALRLREGVRGRSRLSIRATGRALAPVLRSQPGSPASASWRLWNMQFGYTLAGRL